MATIVTAGHSDFLPQTAIAQDQLPEARKRGRSVELHRSHLPILRKADVVVVGGSVAAVAAALQFARAGRKVVLVEHRTYLGWEVSATLKPWVDLGKLAATGQTPEPIVACLKKQMTDEAAGEIPLWIDGFKLTLENLLLEAGVELVYASFPTEAIVTGGAIRGVVIGNKSGRQAILGRLVLDTTSTAAVARVAGAEFQPETAEDFHFIRVMVLEGVRPLDQTTLTVPAEFGIAGNRLTVHNGYRDAYVLIECPMELKLGRIDLEGMMQREIEARLRTMRVAVHLIQNVANFEEAKLGICGYELDGAQTTRLAGPAPGWAAEFKGLDLDFTDKHQDRVRLALASLAGPVNGLWCLNEAARLEGPRRDLLRDPVNAALAGAAFANTMIPRLGSGELPAADETGYGIADYPPHSLEVKSQDSPQRGRSYERLTVAPVKVPVLRDTDFLVVGGGTCGATCANSAGREGAKTVLLELCPGLGGTGTLGGVCSYFYGRYWAGFAIRNANLVDAVHKSIHWPTSANTLNGGWNIEAKMYALLKDSQQSGVDLFFNTMAIATVLQDNQVRGVVAATPYGPIAVLSKITADTTGDGDVAAFAGAKFFYGAARDHYPMWVSLAPYLAPTHKGWRFGHTVDVSNVDDYTRAVLIGRRRYPSQCYDHGNYIATRESRHIMGDVVLTLTDLLRHRQFPDVINLGAGQMDCHRRVTSNWIRVGLIIPILPTEMPYRALLPRGLDSILVGGKAFSAAHDALWNLRNEPEMENLGGAIGVAAAYAIRDGVSPRKVDLRKVQKRLTEVGTLLPDMLTRRNKEEPLGEAAIRAFVKELDGRPLSAWEDVPMAKEGTPHFRQKIPFVEICTADPALAVPILEQELVEATGGRQLRLAQALAMFGSKAGVPVLIAAIERIIASGKVPPPADNQHETDAMSQRHTGIGIPTPPADLVYSLGMTRDSRALAVWDKMASLVAPEPEDFQMRVTLAISLCGRDLLRSGAARGPGGGPNPEENPHPADSEEPVSQEGIPD